MRTTTTTTTAHLYGADAYRLHAVYGFSWDTIAATFGYRSAAEARRYASRYAARALQMFYQPQARSAHGSAPPARTEAA